MATKYASATGNWSTMVWWTTAGGSTTTTAPGVGDDADLNGKTVTIDQNITLDAIVGVTGSLLVSGNRTVNCQMGRTGSGFGWTVNGASQTVTFNGNIVADITISRVQVTGATTTFNMVGNSTGGSAVNIFGLSQTNGIVNFTGIATGGGAASAVGVRISGGICTVNAGSSIVSGTQVTAFGFQIAGGTASVNAAVTAGAGQALSQTNGTLNLTGSLTDSATASALSRTFGTFNYTPGPTDTVTIGGKTFYPTQGGGLVGPSALVSKGAAV